MGKRRRVIDVDVYEEDTDTFYILVTLVRIKEVKETVVADQRKVLIEGKVEEMMMKQKTMTLPTLILVI